MIQKRFACWLPILFSGFGLAQEQQPPTVTVCQVLTNPQKYNGSFIALRGVYESGVDAGGLAGVDCDGALVTAGYTWPSFIWLTGPKEALHKVDFESDRTAWDKLAAMLREAGFDKHLYSATQMANVTFIGVFEIYPDLAQRVRSTRDGLRGFGFGIEGAAPAQLVVKTISLNDIVIEPRRPAPK